MGISNPEIQKKVFGPRWEHEIEKQGWPFWKRLMHRLQDCPICKPKSQTRKLQLAQTPDCDRYRDAGESCGFAKEAQSPRPTAGNSVYNRMTFRVRCSPS